MTDLTFADTPEANSPEQEVVVHSYLDLGEFPPSNELVERKFLIGEEIEINVMVLPQVTSEGDLTPDKILEKRRSILNNQANASGEGYDLPTNTLDEYITGGVWISITYKDGKETRFAKSLPLLKTAGEKYTIETPGIDYEVLFEIDNERSIHLKLLPRPKENRVPLPASA